MTSFLKRQLRELIAMLEATGARLLGLTVLLVLAVVFFIAGFVFLAIALYLEVAASEGTIIAALAVAGLNFLVVIVCLVVLLLLRRRAAPPKMNPAEKQEAAFAESIDRTMAPLVAVLHDANLKPEEVALRLGARLSKEIGPFGLVVLSLVAGFLFSGRMKSPKKSEEKTEEKKSEKA